MIGVLNPQLAFEQIDDLKYFSELSKRIFHITLGQIDAIEKLVVPNGIELPNIIKLQAPKIYT